MRLYSICGKYGKKCIVAFLVLLLLSGTACGEEPDPENPVEETAAPGEEYVYVPEYTVKELPDDLNDCKILMQGDRVYQSCSFLNLESGRTSWELTASSLDGELFWKLERSRDTDESYVAYIVDYDADGEGNVYTVEAAYPSEEDRSQVFYYLCVYDSTGKKTVAQDITDILEEAGSREIPAEILLDGAGRIYVNCTDVVLLFEADGSFAGKIAGEESAFMGKDAEGEICLFYQDLSSADYAMQGVTLDFERAARGEVFGNLPRMSGQCVPGIQGDFLISDGSRVYEYKRETQSLEPLFDWQDYDIIGSDVAGMGPTGDGGLYVVTKNWRARTSEIVLLKPVRASEVVPKQEIVLGVLREDAYLQEQVVSFNRSSGEYRVVLRAYEDSNAGVSYEEGKNDLYLDITTGNSPDIFEMSQLDPEELTLAGAVEDLRPYLENSSVLDEEDYLENVLDGYTYAGKLAGIPHTVFLRSVAGSASGLGERDWTPQEVLSYAEEHPGSRLFAHYTRDRMLDFCFGYDPDAFITEEGGELRFESELCARLLELIKEYPESTAPGEDQPSDAELLQSGEVLLYPAQIGYFYEAELYPFLFGEPVRFVGYPSGDGTRKAVLECESLYGISAASWQKEGAWAFVEYCLSRPAESYGFSPRISCLEEQISREKECKRDEEGNPVNDETGNPLPAWGPVGQSIGDASTFFYYRIPGKEEIAVVRELLETAAPARTGAGEILAVAQEEAGAYFAGQKTAEEAADIIGRRILLYRQERQ